MEVCVYRKYENKLNFKQMLKILLKNYSDNMHTTYFSFSFLFFLKNHMIYFKLANKIMHLPLSQT